jgi:tetratricopeptide (TPR) repeat protein
MNREEIRHLRGDRTRADFAHELGVNAHSVYRWELPDTSPHARRPRGDVLAKLERLAQRRTETDDSIPVTAALQHLLDGSWREAENVFLHVLRDRDVTPLTRSLASIGLALAELIYRADVRRAFTALAPALARDAPELPLAEAVAALVHSYPDPQIFDLGRVHAHARRAELLDRSNTALVRAYVVTAEANAALLAGNDDLLAHALSRLEGITSAALPELPAMFLDLHRSLAATLAGNTEKALERIDRVLANPRVAAYPSIEARACSMRALRMLDNLGDPEEALVLARRAREISQQHHLAVGIHSAIGLRAEAEALMRLCRLDEAAAVFAEADRLFAEHGFPITVIFPAQARYLLTIGASDQLATLAARVDSVDLPSLRGSCRVYAAWLAASAELSRDSDPTATLRAYERAVQLATAFSFIERDLLVTYAGAALVYGTTSHAREVLSRAQRASDRRPAAWVSAALRRIEGTLLVEDGRIAEGRSIIEAATLTFEAAGDRLDATLARYANAALDRALGTDGATERVDTALADLRALGVIREPWIERVDARVRAAVERGETRDAADGVRDQHVGAGTETPYLTAGATMALDLELPLRRLAVPGATPAMMRRELVAVAEQICGARAMLVDADATSFAHAHTWFDVDAGGGKRLQLGVATAPSIATASALRIIALVGGLALDVAELRSGGRARTEPSDVAFEIPGVVAASPAMRRLLSDVGRLATSRATVVISGESGTGKEVIAHALHTLSSRANQPFVAFNCAAVPHELFEGQLFGYRRGAFTGATADHPGVVRSADGGTVFLDEIGELPLDIQPKLLRFLDSHEVFPLGASRPVIVDVRVVSATNRDLAAEVARGRFREDLFYRLQVVPMSIPPLRQRREDIIPLARNFARELAPNRPPAFSPDAIAALTSHTWPGNVRELRNVIARAMAFEPVPELLTRATLGL